MCIASIGTSCSVIALILLAACLLVGCRGPVVDLKAKLLAAAALEIPESPMHMLGGAQDQSEVINKSVTLAFNPSTGIVDGYQIHWGTASGIHPSSMDVGKNLGGTVTNLMPDTTYYFIAKSYWGVFPNVVESFPSNEAIYRTLKNQTFVSIIVETSAKPKGPWSPVVTNIVNSTNVQQYFRANIIPK